MFIICSEVNVQKHQHYHYYGRNRRSAISSQATIKNEEFQQSDIRKQKIHITTAKKRQSQQVGKSKRSSKDIKQKCQKGLTKTRMTTLSHGKHNNGLDFTRKIQSWKGAMLNTEGTSLNLQEGYKIKKSEDLISFRTSNNISEEKIDETLLTFKSPNTFYQNCKHRRLESHNAHTVVSQECMEEIEEVVNGKEYVIEESFIYDHNVASKFKQITPSYKFNQYEEFLAVEVGESTIISIKAIPLEDSPTIVSKELQNYDKIGSHPNILSFYQINLHYQKQLLIKQPYTSHLIGSKLTETEIQNILIDVGDALQYLKEKKVYMDYIQLQDIRQVVGVYKLADLSATLEEEKVSVSDNLFSLRSKLFDLCYY